VTEGQGNCGSGVRAAKAHGRNLRKGRVSEPGRIYLVTTTTHNRQRFFDDFHLGWIVVGAMRHHDRAGSTDTLAYVVMPDHLHWLFSLGTGSSLDKVLHSMKSYSGKRIGNNSGAGQGPVWQSGYHDHALRKEEDLVHLARYVVANPVRAGLVERLGDYPLWDAKWI
jgi:REP element-mobilizing transposase RayT